MTEWLIDIGGWIGAGLLLSAYALVSRGFISGQSRAYQGLNIGGSALFILNSGYHGAYPSAGLNVIWLSIGAYTLYRISRPRSDENAES